MTPGLIERLEAVGEGSRELDRDVWQATGGWDGVDAPPSFTTSLDAALALAERVLGEDEALYWLRAVTREAEEDTVSGCIKHLPIDLCIAILKARATQEQG